MADLHVTHHERVEGHKHRWRVHLHGRERPMFVELPDGEREGLDMSDEEIHQLLPTALRRRAQDNRDDALPGEGEEDVTWDAPVRVYQTHFMG
jgi:hypothetical protein